MFLVRHSISSHGQIGPIAFGRGRQGLGLSRLRMLVTVAPPQIREK
jgi:hypothetical protein